MNSLVRLFGGVTHTDYVAHRDLLERALDWDRLAGIDLRGPEYWPVDVRPTMSPIRRSREKRASDQTAHRL